ncbi:MAG: hypothetical protein COB78_09930 [Hyphomicrobiales bacterium]|nr:MAG: hypothetical protein COB78_09930 [Hyphomicrobiales bacterium]
MIDRETKLPLSKTGEDYTDWDVDHQDPMDGVVNWAPIFDNDGAVIGFTVSTGNNEQDSIYRNLIVQAVNSHQPLIEALEKAQTKLFEAQDKFWVIHCNHPGKHVSERQEQDKQFLATLSERMRNAGDDVRAALSQAQTDSPTTTLKGDG